MWFKSMRRRKVTLGPVTCSVIIVPRLFIIITLADVGVRTKMD